METLEEEIGAKDAEIAELVEVTFICTLSLSVALNKALSPMWQVLAIPTISNPNPNPNPSLYPSPIHNHTANPIYNPTASPTLNPEPHRAWNP